MARQALCHGCRRCVNLCTAFPKLFDLVDESPTLEVDGIPKKDYWEVIDRCYLCDMCYMTKCPYVPPHEWNVDFPHLMLRAKAVKFRKGGVTFRDKLLSSTDALGKLASIPVVVQMVNAANRAAPVRKVMDNSAVAERFRGLGANPGASSPEEFSKRIRDELAQWRVLVKKLNLKFE